MTFSILGTILLILALLIAVLAFFMGVGMLLTVMQLQAELRQLTTRVHELEVKLATKAPIEPPPAIPVRSRREIH